MSVHYKWLHFTNVPRLIVGTGTSRGHTQTDRQTHTHQVTHIFTFASGRCGLEGGSCDCEFDCVVVVCTVIDVCGGGFELVGA